MKMKVTKTKGIKRGNEKKKENISTRRGKRVKGRGNKESNRQHGEDPCFES
jgi:hypothetical protein